MKTIGILAAMHDEMAALLHQMADKVTVHQIGQREYHEGYLYGCHCVLVLARIGKVAAAATAVTLIREFKADEIIFTGLAGAVAQDVAIGDVIVAQSLLQHDLDASPIFPRYEVPLLGCDRFFSEPKLSDEVFACARDYFDYDFKNDIDAGLRTRFGLSEPRVHRGLIVSGDQFINQAQQVHELRRRLPDALCVEMEGAAVAQICFEYAAAFAVFRTISDKADDGAASDFSQFLTEIASHYSAGILKRYLLARAHTASLSLHVRHAND